MGSGDLRLGTGGTQGRRQADQGLGQGGSWDWGQSWGQGVSDWSSKGTGLGARVRAV